MPGLGSNPGPSALYARALPIKLPLATVGEPPDQLSHCTTVEVVRSPSTIC